MKGKKPYWKMTAAELREATREFDKPFAFETGKPLTAGDKQKLRQAREHARKVKRGRPRVGLGASRITTTVERSLLERVDAFAEAHQMTRAEVIAKGMERVLADGG